MIIEIAVTKLILIPNNLCVVTFIISIFAMIIIALISIIVIVVVFMR